MLIKKMMLCTSFCKVVIDVLDSTKVPKEIGEMVICLMLDFLI